MKLHITILVALFSIFLSIDSVSQIVSGPEAKEYNKAKALYAAKAYLMYNVLGGPKGILHFEIDALAAASSGELISLVYRCPELGKEGLILGFYNNRWNSSGVHYAEYQFRHFPKDSALYLLNSINKMKEDEFKYIDANEDNNIYFQVYDMIFLINRSEIPLEGKATNIRVFWGDFDSDWEIVAFNRTKRRLERRLKE